MADRTSKRDQVLKGIIGGIKGYFDVMGERNKIMGDLISNELKARSNFFYKLQEKEYLGPLEREKLGFQQILKNKFLHEGEGADEYGRPVAEVGGRTVPYGQTIQAGQEDVFSKPITPEARLGKEGFEPYYPSQKENIYKRIQQRREAGLPITPRMQQFENEYLGIKTEDDVLKEVRKYQDLAAKEGWTLNVDPNMSPAKQLEKVRTLYATKKGTKKEELQAITDEKGNIIGYRPKGAVFRPRMGITKTSAMGILADPVKAQQLQKAFPELYQEVLSVATEAENIEAETPPNRTFAEDDKGQKIYSDDNGITWFNAETNEKIE